MMIIQYVTICYYCFSSDSIISLQLSVELSSVTISPLAVAASLSYDLDFASVIIPDLDFVSVRHQLELDLDFASVQSLID